MSTNNPNNPSAAKQPRRYPGLTLRLLGREEPAMGPGRAGLIEAIERTGSISAAARSMEMSYKRAWQLVEAVNSAFSGPLVTASTGGKQGGGARVTDLGRDVVTRFRRMEGKASAAIEADLKAMNALLRPAARAKSRTGSR